MDTLPQNNSVHGSGATAKKEKKDSVIEKDQDINKGGAETYQNTRDYIADEISYLELLLRYTIAVNNNADKQTGNSLFLSQGYISGLFNSNIAENQNGGPEPETDQDPEENHETLKDIENELENQRELIESKIKHTMVVNSAEEKLYRFNKLISIYRLNPIEIQILFIALAPLLNAKYEKIYAYVQDDIQQRLPTLQLLYLIFGQDIATVNAIRDVMSKAASLVLNNLIYYANAIQETANSPFYIDPRIADYLLGGDSIDPELIGVMKVGSNVPEQPEILNESVISSVENFCSLIEKTIGSESSNAFQYLGIIFNGSAPEEKKQALKLLAKKLAANYFIIDIRLLTFQPERAEDLFARIFREAALFDAVVYFENSDILSEHPHFVHLLLSHLDRKQSLLPVIFDLGGVLTSITDRSDMVEISFHTPDYHARKQIWTHYLNGSGLNGAMVDRFSDRFQFNVSQIKKTVQSAKLRMEMEGRNKIEDKDVYYGSSRHTFHKLARFGVRISKRYAIDDIVLPADRIDHLHEIVNQYKNRTMVMENWGFGEKVAYGKGLTVLFSGPSGTGKTMAASVVARELKLDIFKIDLSSIVSKYIGETEKNLSNIFNEATLSNAILFFDEADALFGKRTEVKDSHDRYANIETSFLLQKMEEYEGITILASNFRQNMDNAFLRRISFIIEFPFPDQVLRKKLWRKIFPHSAPLDAKIDYDFLAQKIEMTGGNIKNMALAAAYMASNDSADIQMGHIMKAVKREYEKQGKPFIPSEFLPYAEFLTKPKMGAR